MINTDEYELKDNESNYLQTMQPSIYGNMMYKQTFIPAEMYDAALVSLRMGQFNSMEPIYPGHEPVLNLKTTINIKNLTTNIESKFYGVPEGLVYHGILPWVHMPLEKPVRFEPGQKGEITISSAGGFDYVNGVMKGKASIMYITRDPSITYTRGALYRYQSWNNTWLKMVFRNKPYLASFRLWSKKHKNVP
jgi:hypothetical protein